MCVKLSEQCPAPSKHRIKLVSVSAMVITMSGRPEGKSQRERAQGQECRRGVCFGREHTWAQTPAPDSQCGLEPHTPSPRPGVLVWEMDRHGERRAQGWTLEHHIPAGFSGGPGRGAARQTPPIQGTAEALDRQRVREHRPATWRQSQRARPPYKHFHIHSQKIRGVAAKPRKKNHEASKTQRHNLSGALGPHKRSRTKGQMSPGGGRASHVPPSTDTRVPTPHTLTRAHTHTHRLSRAHKRMHAPTGTRVYMLSHGCVPAPSRGSTCSCMHTLPEARGGTQAAPGLQGLGAYALSTGKGLPPGSGL